MDLAFYIIRAPVRALGKSTVLDGGCCSCYLIGKEEEEPVLLSSNMMVFLWGVFLVLFHVRNSCRRAEATAG